MRCSRCKGPTGGRSRCEACLRKSREDYRARRQAGSCAQSGCENPATLWNAYCRDCLDRKNPVTREAKRAARAKPK